MLFILQTQPQKELFDFSFNTNTLSSYEMDVEETYISLKDRRATKHLFEFLN